MMKRITITLDDDIYAILVDYAADTSKEDLTRLSVSKAIRKILAFKLSEMNYYPLSPKRQQGLHQILRKRESQQQQQSEQGQQRNQIGV